MYLFFPQCGLLPNFCCHQKVQYSPYWVFSVGGFHLPSRLCLNALVLLRGNLSDLLIKLSLRAMLGAHKCMCKTKHMHAMQELVLQFCLADFLV